MHHIGDLFNRSGSQMNLFGRCGNGIGSLYGLTGRAVGGRRLRNARGTRASDPHGSQHDAAVLSGHVKILRAFEIGQDRFRQSQPVFGCQFGEHDNLVCKELLNYFINHFNLHYGVYKIV